VTMDDLRTRARSAPWLSYHGACDPLDERGAYSIDVERVRSGWDALAWTEHLMSKTWLGVTDWRHVLGRIAKEHGSSEAS
jgi:hypothetical protein